MPPTSQQQQTREFKTLNHNHHLQRSFYEYDPTVYDAPVFASLAYPARLPVPSFQHQADPRLGLLQQEQQQQHELAFAAAGLGVSSASSFRPHHYLPLRSRQQQQRRHARAAAMAASFQPPTATDEELAELQKLSNEYEPEVTGPLVGHRQPSTAITTEYASADPVFQAKTAALPQKYSHYRTVRGDGRCGWRAIAFGYFETLIRLGDSNKFVEEEARLRSLANVLNAAGFDPMLYEDFADETFDLLRKVASATQTGDAEDVLLEAFNDESLQNFVLTHLKTLTAAWMKTRPNDWAPWLLGVTVDEYCNASIMPIGSEIDNVGLTALKDVFLSPAGIALEVYYLDRSEGSEVNMHRFDPVNSGGYDIGTVRLLYRPGHYDLLYKLEDMPAASIPSAAVPTYLQYNSQAHQPLALGIEDPIAHIPGMSFANGIQGWNSFQGTEFFASPTFAQHTVPTPAAPAPQPQMHHQPVYVTPAPAHLVVPPPTQMLQELALRPVSQDSMAAHAPTFQRQLDQGPFRPSHYEFTPDFFQNTSQVQFQTSIFRNSHFNTAHFMNPDFQPEEWHPDDDYVTISSNRPPRGHRNSG